MAWTPTDRRFLRSLRICADAYPVPLPRFRVEVTRKGHVGMYDARTRRVWLFLPEHFADPYASAQDMTQQMNAYEEEHHGRDQDAAGSADRTGEVP